MKQSTDASNQKITYGNTGREQGKKQMKKGKGRWPAHPQKRVSEVVCVRCVWHDHRNDAAGAPALDSDERKPESPFVITI